MMKIILALTILFPPAAVGGRTVAPPPPAPPQAVLMTVEHIGGGLYFVKGGSGANTAFSVGANGVTVVDAKMTADAAKDMLSLIAKVTDKPVKTIILTHSDRDHVDGLTGFPPGMEIIASANTKKEMAEAPADEKEAGRLPSLSGRTFTGTMTFDAGGETLSLRQLGPAHTGGDTAVIFPKEKAAVIGDLAFIGRDPLIHRGKGGTVFGYLAALRTMIGWDDVDVYLSGHADALSKEDLKTLLSSLEEKVGKVKELFASGKTLEEVRAALLPPPAPDAPASRRPSFVENVYLELAEKK